MNSSRSTEHSGSLGETSKRTVLITGSGTGVGRASAIRFAKLGFNVAVNYSRSAAEAEETAELVKSKGADAIVCQANVAVESQVSSMMDEIERAFGRLDVLVNNAARTHFVNGSDLESMTEQKWDEILAVNLKGAFFCSKAAAPLLKMAKDGDVDARSGAIINTSSVAGVTGRGSCIAYAASKGALNTMTKSLALALAPQIRVNAVLPGPIDSRWIREGENDWDLNEMTAGYPIPRASSPDEIADGIIFFATGTSMATGQLLMIDGGQTLR